MRLHLRGLFRSVETLKSENASYFADDAQVQTVPPRVLVAGSQTGTKRTSTARAVQSGS
jgi:hypothetical protein